MDDTTTSQGPVPVSFDLTDPGIQQDPFPAYRPLRTTGPVHELPGDGRPTFVVSRHEEAAAVLLDPATFSSRLLPLPTMLFLDPPEHDRIRRTASRAFTPRAIAKLEPRIRAIATDLAERWIADGGGDFVAGFAGRLPVYVVGELLGVPTADWERLRELSDGTIRALSVLAGAGGPDADHALACALALAQLLGEVADRHRGSDADTITARLVAAEGSGELSRDELVGFLQLLFVAGHETTMGLLSHGAERLAGDAALLARLLVDRSLVRRFVEETLRTHAPLQRLFRVTTRDTDLGGVAIPADSMVVVLIGSANRDDHRHAAGEAFDLDVSEANHLAFGLGIHHCLGAPLARLEAQVAFDVLLDRVASLRLDPDHPPQRFFGATTSELWCSTLHLQVEGLVTATP